MEKPGMSGRLFDDLAVKLGVAASTGVFRGDQVA